MRYLTFLLIVFISISCQNRNSKPDRPDSRYSVDTVIMDAKGRNLYLQGLFFTSDLNQQKNSLFMFNQFDHSIDKIDLENLEWADNYPLEAEGPNGTGQYVNVFEVLNDSLFFIQSFGKSGVFDRNGTLVERIDWLNAIDSNGLKYEEIPRYVIAVDAEHLTVFGLRYDNQNRDVFLDILSAQDHSVKRRDIDPERSSYHHFVLALDDPQYRTFMDPLVYIRQENYLIISHQYSSEMILFNAQGELVKTVCYTPQLTPKRARDLSGMTITSQEQINKEYQHFLEQVRFGPPVWDSVKKRYLRLSAQRVFSDSREEGAMLPEIQEIKVYLSVFDADFNLLLELPIPELSSETDQYFAKDGKLWVYQNFADELGFILIGI